jgi:ABC-2 type transport system permease protein
VSPYASVFRLRFAVGLQYRVAAFAGVATQFFWGFMLIMVYRAFFGGAGAAAASAGGAGAAAAISGAAPISLAQLASYVWLQQAFLALVVLWFRDSELLNLIVSGNVAYELCRPQDLYFFWYARLISARLAAAALRCLPILAVAFFLPPPYRLSPPADAAAFFLFLLTLGLGLGVLVALSMFSYIGTFITLSPYGTMVILGTLGDFCSGGIVPLPLMPEGLRNVMLVLPFRLASDLPFRIYSGHIPPSEALWGILLQIAWFAALLLLGRRAMAGVLKRTVIQGA